MPKSSSSINPFSRLLKPDSHRDLFRLLADSIADSVLVIDSNCQDIVHVNRAFLHLSGYSRSDLAILSPARLFPGDEGQKILGLIQESSEGALCELCEISFRMHDGSISQIDLEARAVPPVKKEILITLRISSVRLQQESVRNAQTEQLALLTGIAEDLFSMDENAVDDALKMAQRLLLASAVGMYRVSAATPKYHREGNLPDNFPDDLEMNEVELLQEPSTWNLGQRPEHPLQKAARAAGIQELRTAPIGSTRAWVGILLVGWTDPESMPPNVEPLIAIITTLCHAGLLMELQKLIARQLERKNRQLEFDLEDQFSAVSDGLLFLDPELNITRANPASALLLGYNENELPNHPIQDILVGPKDILSTLLGAQGHQLDAEIPQLIIHRSDGTPFPIHLRVVPRPRVDGTGLLLVLSDQSEVQAIEDQNEALAQRALLGEVTAIFAHEVRNPINNISTGVQLISSRLGEEHPQYASLDRIRNECTRLDQLLSDVLFFARPLELKMINIDLAELLERLLNRWKPRFQQAKIHCHSSFDPETPLASADPRTLEQVLVNIITNAMQAMDEDGTLSVRLAPKKAAQGDVVEIRIADTGPGIPPDMIERIFNPFFTTKKSGTGLGLAISRRILSAHKGNIDVESFPGAGTIFSIHLPIGKI